MKCEKCGTINKKNQKFCKNCGVELNRKNEEKKSISITELKKYWENKIVKYSLLIGLVLLSMIIYFACFRFKNYSVQELYDIKVEGVDGYGTLKITEKENLPSAALEKLVGTATISATKNSGLKNGDVITITIQYNEMVSKKEKIKIKKQYQYKVNQLKTGEVLDLFKDLELTYSNKSPYLKIQLLNKNTELEKYNIHYQITSLEKNKSNYRVKKGFYQNGEKIKIEVTYEKEKVNKDGYIVPKDYQELEIPIQDTYISDTKELTEERIAPMIQKMSERISEYATAENIERQACYGLLWCLDTSYERIKEPELLNLYFGYKVDVQSGVYYDSSHTTLLGTYKITYGRGEIYCNVHENDFYLTKEGAFSDFVDGDRILCYGELRGAKTHADQNFKDKYRYELTEVKN